MFHYCNLVVKSLSLLKERRADCALAKTIPVYFYGSTPKRCYLVVLFIRLFMITLHDKTYTCPVDVTLGFIGGKWKLLILFHLHYFTKRSYADIRNNLPGVSEKMLSQQLKELEKDRLIEKTVLSAKPYRVTYELSAMGKSLAPLYEFASEWGITYLKTHGIDYIQDQHLYK